MPMFGTRFELAFARTTALPGALLAAPFHAPHAVGGSGTVTQIAKIRIGAAPPAIFALLDPSAAANRWCLRGQTVEIVAARHFRLIESPESDRPFSLTVTKSLPPSRMAYRCSPEDGQPIGAVLSSASVYEIAPLGRGASVTLEETTEFISGLTRGSFAFHALAMRNSMRIDLLRLKFEAEEGRDADARAA